jgi:tRNA pseudouridine38-40 synthase
MYKVNYYLKIAYLGTNYFGWQKQPNKPTIQQVIEDKLEILFKHKVKLIGSGRTDAKVHALGQVANFKTDLDRKPVEIYKYLNATLPRDIAILDVKKVPLNFHSRFSARGKTYLYKIYTKPNPFLINRAWYISRDFDITKIIDALKVIKDSDCKISMSKGEIKTKRKVEIRDIKLKFDGDIVDIEITASHFLRYMVRKIIGHAIQVGFGRLSIEDLKDILNSKDQTRAIYIAPPEGLYLKEVYYNPEDLVLDGQS